jgi:hypothetical protein
MISSDRREARAEARRLIKQLVDELEEGEHLGAPSRSGDRIVIPIESVPDARDAEDASVRALLAAWLDHPPPPE